MAEITPVAGYEKPIGGEKHSRAMHNRNIDRSESVAAMVAKLPKGYMPESKLRTGGSTGVTSLAVIENIASFTFKANRNYRISWNARYTMTNATDYFTVKIQTTPVTETSTSTANLTELIGRPLSPNTGGAGQPMYIEDIRTYTADTTVQIKFTAEPSLGGSTWQMEAGRNIFLIEDLGQV